MAGIFDHYRDEVFATYAAELRFRDRVVGGIPSNPKLIEAWLRTKMGITAEEEVMALTVETLRDLGIEPEVLDESGAQTFDTLAQASEAIAKKSHLTMFKRDEAGLYLESRIVKAMLKEQVAVLYPGSVAAATDRESAAELRAHRWGQTGKGPKAAIAEWCVIDPDRIPLGVAEPTGIDLSVGHVTGPQGPRSTLDLYEYVERAAVSFTVMVLQDRVRDLYWPHIWLAAQEGGLGSKRSQGFGRFDLLKWERVRSYRPRADLVAEPRQAAAGRGRRSGGRPEDGQGQGPPEGIVVGAKDQ